MLLGAGFDTISINVDNPEFLHKFYSAYTKETNWGLKYIKTPFFYMQGDRLDTSYNQTRDNSLRKVNAFYAGLYQYRYNRVDVYIDIESDLSMLSLAFNYPKKHDKVVYSNNGSFYKGREIGLRIYDKKLQLGKKKATNVSGFYEKATNVWRIEFQLRFPKKSWFSNESLFEQIKDLYFPFQKLNTYCSVKDTPYKLLIARVLKNHGKEPILDILSFEKNKTRKEVLRKSLLEGLKEVSLYNTIEEGLCKIKSLTNETDEQIKYNRERFNKITQKTFT